MKKIVSILLLGTLVLSMTACGGKKEEPKTEAPAAEETSTSQITEAQTALSSEPEEPEEPEYTCMPEMYEADWEDGLIQIADIVFDTKIEYTLKELFDIFSSTQYQLSIKRESGEIEDYNENGLAGPKSRVALLVKHNDIVLAQLSCWNPKDDYSPLKDCLLYDFQMHIEKEYPIWIASGIQPFDLTYYNIEETINSDLLENQDNYFDITTQTTANQYMRYSFRIDLSDSTLDNFSFRVSYTQ